MPFQEKKYEGVYSGAGNTFLFFETPLAASTEELCRNSKVDGVAWIKPSSSDCFMQLFNADGSEAEMCGNALRCTVLFLKNKGLLKNTYSIETRSGVRKAWWEAEEVATELEVATFRPGITLDAGFGPIKGNILNTGVPHFVIFVTNVARLDVESLGKAIRHHRFFQPEGTNVTFCSFSTLSSLYVRTYERGVERETLACGTGAAAAAFAAMALYQAPPPLKMITRSGEILQARTHLNTEALKADDETDGQTISGLARQRCRLVLRGPVKKIG